MEPEKIMKLKIAQLITEIEMYFQHVEKINLDRYGIDEINWDKMDNLPALVALAEDIIKNNSTYSSNWNTYGYYHWEHNKEISKYVKILKPYAEKLENQVNLTFTELFSTQEDNSEELDLNNKEISLNNEIIKESNRVFIVHGHNEGMKESVARLLEKLELIPIILHEQPNKGLTIVEKLIEYSNVSYAIILISPDDIGRSINQESKDARYRARQNVILELGYFVGKLGREKVLVLLKIDKEKHIEIPSDILGVGYTPYDSEGAWKSKLVDELRVVGYKVDKN